jgi:hypothetical protein
MQGVSCYPYQYKITNKKIPFKLKVPKKIPVTDNNPQEISRQQYLAGKKALERGEYRQSIADLEAATTSVNLASRLGGEIQIWLVTAYQAAGDVTTAISLCRQLTRHPHPLVRQQAQKILYIIEAPQLKRPKEWMSEIPDLGNMPEEVSQLSIAAKSTTNRTNRQQKLESQESIDPTTIDTKDNQFIWFALIASLLVIGGLFYR